MAHLRVSIDLVLGHRFSSAGITRYTPIICEYRSITDLCFISGVYISADKQFVVYGFALTSITGPTLGVFFGGYIIDRQGGYQDDTGKSVVMALRTICLFGKYCETQSPYC